MLDIGCMKHDAHQLDLGSLDERRSICSCRFVQQSESVLNILQRLSMHSCACLSCSKVSAAQ